MKYLDADLRPQEIEADGLLATCLQHEIDHTKGVLFIDHISKLKRDMVVKKFRKRQRRPRASSHWPRIRSLRIISADLFLVVMPGHRHSKDGVLSHAYVPGIHVFTEVE